MGKWSKCVSVLVGTRAFLVVALAMPVAGQVTSRVSVDSSGVQGNNGSSGGTFSADGRYFAFSSSATNLVLSDSNVSSDVFVRDCQTGLIERVSVSSSGGAGNDNSTYGAISADGRYVAFNSSATNLVPGDTNGRIDVFVRDRQTGLTERVSVSSSETQGNNTSTFASMSADGRYVAFGSEAVNLVSGDTNSVYDVFVRDRQSGLTERVSVDSSEVQGNGVSDSPEISADGRYVAFHSSASNLVPGDTNAIPDVFVRDLQSGLTERVSVNSSAAEGDDESYHGCLSADGRYVAFVSRASNMVAGDTNGTNDIFVRDRQLGVTERVSIDSIGTEANGLSGDQWISSDGRFVAFSSLATNLVVGDTNLVRDIFLRDRQLGVTERVSVDSSGAQGNGESGLYGVSISADSRYVAFTSSSSNLVPGDTNGKRDTFVRDREYAPFTSLCDPGTGDVMACPCANPPSGLGRGCNNHGSATGGATLSASGIAFLSADSVVLSATDENSTALTVFWTGNTLTASTGVVHGAGVRCVTGLKRLYSGSASGGAISRPGGLDPTVSVRSATVGAAITAGQTRYYFSIYRDPLATGPCGNPASTINLSNAVGVMWTP